MHKICLSLIIIHSVLLLELAGSNKAVGWDSVNTAVLTYPQDDYSKKFERLVQSRVEEILEDNGIVILDREKAEEMRSGTPEMMSPDGFLTAERLLEIQETYRIDRILNIYFGVDSSPGVGSYYTSTANANLRIIDVDATVNAASSRPMGVVGNPPSDGLTAQAASTNAIRRAIDDILLSVNLRGVFPAEPRRLKLKLTGPVRNLQDSVDVKRSEIDSSLENIANLHNQTWQQERISATAVSPGGGLAAVAGYTWSRSMGQQRRSYGSRVHIIDMQNSNTLNILDASPLGIPRRHEVASKEIYALKFLENWRYLIAVNGNEIFFWDVEQGNLLTSLAHNVRASSAQLGFKRLNDQIIIGVVLNDMKPIHYQVEVAER